MKTSIPEARLPRGTVLLVSTMALLLLAAPGDLLASAPDENQAATARITLLSRPGAMQVTALAPGLDDQAFALGIPATIGCREALLVNFPEAKIEWQGPDADGVVRDCPACEPPTRRSCSALRWAAGYGTC